jgi:ectoine hydroxylase-related dioxygenase (phytanoyl-CoA dioxygenase family)
MDNLRKHQQEVFEKGYTVVECVFDNDEITKLISTIDKADQSKPTFRKSNDLFAIRQFLKEVPEIVPIVFTHKLNSIINTLFDDDYFVVKSIYFDKPGESNWFVAYHQDLTISVNTKTDIPGYSGWTVKQNQYAVQPPIDVLEGNFTIRIHLDDTNEYNGALKVVRGSHLKGVYRPENIDWSIETEDVCTVKRGGVMLMRPLLLHASERTTNNKKRRVIHIEYSRAKLPNEINWSELN